jgi:hypothetical protein
MNQLIVRGMVVLQLIGTIKMFKKIWEWIKITQEIGQDVEIKIRPGITLKKETELNPFGITKIFIPNIACSNIQEQMIQL